MNSFTYMDYLSTMSRAGVLYSATMGILMTGDGPAVVLSLLLLFRFLLFLLANS